MERQSQMAVQMIKKKKMAKIQKKGNFFDSANYELERNKKFESDSSDKSKEEKT